MSREEQERRAVAAVMADPAYARRLGAAAIERRDAAVEDGGPAVADVWASIAACCSEGLARLEQLKRDVDSSLAQVLPFDIEPD